MKIVILIIMQYSVLWYDDITFSNIVWGLLLFSFVAFISIQCVRQLYFILLWIEALKSNDNNKIIFILIMVTIIMATIWIGLYYSGSMQSQTWPKETGGWKTCYLQWIEILLWWWRKWHSLTICMKCCNAIHQFCEETWMRLYT